MCSSNQTCSHEALITFDNTNISDDSNVLARCYFFSLGTLAFQFHLSPTCESFLLFSQLSRPVQVWISSWKVQLEAFWFWFCWFYRQHAVNPILIITKDSLTVPNLMEFSIVLGSLGVSGNVRIVSSFVSWTSRIIVASKWFEGSQLSIEDVEPNPRRTQQSLSTQITLSRTLAVHVALIEFIENQKRFASFVSTFWCCRSPNQPVMARVRLTTSLLKVDQRRSQEYAVKIPDNTCMLMLKESCRFRLWSQRRKPEISTGDGKSKFPKWNATQSFEVCRRHDCLTKVWVFFFSSQRLPSISPTASRIHSKLQLCDGWACKTELNRCDGHTADCQLRLQNLHQNAACEMFDHIQKSKLQSIQISTTKNCIFQPTSDPYAFTLSEDVKSIDPGLLGTSVLMSQNCGSDYIVIMSPSQVDNTTMTALPGNQFCGLGIADIYSEHDNLLLKKK